MGSRNDVTSATSRLLEKSFLDDKQGCHPVDINHEFPLFLASICIVKFSWSMKLV